MIETLQEGMSAAQVFAVLNALIAEHNELMTALGGVLAGGELSYNALTDKPTLDGVELTGDVSSADLSLTVDNAVLERVDAMESSMSSFATLRDSDAARISTLESNRTADIARVAALEGERTERDNQVSALVSNAALVVAASNQATTAAATAQEAASGVATNAAFLEVADRVKKTVDRLNMVASAVVLLENNGCTDGRQTLSAAMNGMCIADIANTFTFE